MIYVSTGGFRGKTAVEAANELLSAGIQGIELSGGSYAPELLASLVEMTDRAHFQLHNYFPPPREPFVLNLASLDDAVGERSMAFMDRAVECCAELGATVYSFHAGFLMDPAVESLGVAIPATRLFRREAAIEIFTSRVHSLAQAARRAGITLMIENNVLSRVNASAFSENPFLMCTPEESASIMERMPDGVNLLLDVGHLKVSARSLDFDPSSMFEVCAKWIGGYHLSENDGLSDSNIALTNESWFWPHLDPKVGYYSVEVYGCSAQQLHEQVRLVEMSQPSHLIHDVSHE